MAAQNYGLLTGFKMSEVNTKINILGFSQAQMEAFFKTMDEPKFRAVQVMKWIHQFGVDDFDSMTKVSLKR
jgi:23S rRNA (adenine2503-C2)-methyltransferase